MKDRAFVIALKRANDIKLCSLKGEPLKGLGSELSQYARVFPPVVTEDMRIHNVHIDVHIDIYLSIQYTHPARNTSDICQFQA